MSTKKGQGKRGRVAVPPERSRQLMAWARKIDAEEKDEIIARGRRVLAEYDALMSVVRMLKAERQAQGLTLEELAVRTGIGKSNLSKLENGRLPNPTIQTLHRIADALGRSIRVQLA